MAASLEIGRVGAIILRQMRRPIMSLLVVYAVAVFGMTVIPGKEIDGQTYYMSLFHAFYFISYTATTTGFGEIPDEFSEAQRIWAIACLYVSVIAWFYAIGAIIRLIQNPYFRLALAERNFANSVERIIGPFYILCGFGDTGSLLARGLSDARIPTVVLEADEARVQALTLRDYKVPMPGLCADASIPIHLQEAGLERLNCKAVIAATNNEEVNLRISAIVSLLNSNAMIVTRSRVDVFEETLSSWSRNLHIVDPFKVFAKGLSAAIFNPVLYMFNEWLVGASGATSARLSRWLDGTLEPRVRVPPKGKWIICGYGRMGHEAHEMLAKNGLKVAVIDPHPGRSDEDGLSQYVVGRTTAKTLRNAGIEDAVGILAGTDDDGHNLGILLNARALNPNLFVIVRQNRHANEVAFNKANADIIMQPSLVTARRILLTLIAPLLKPFFKLLLRLPENIKEEFMNNLLRRLVETVGDEKPHLLTLDINDETSSAVVELLDREETVLLGDVLRNPVDREHYIDTVPLVVCSEPSQNCSDTAIQVLPGNDYAINKGDQLLLCGREKAHRLFDSTLNNEYALHYLRTGKEKPRGFLMQWLVKRYPPLAG
jgi:voltage-gated potassium channel